LNNIHTQREETTSTKATFLQFKLFFSWYRSSTSETFTN